MPQTCPFCAAVESSVTRSGTSIGSTCVIRTDTTSTFEEAHPEWAVFSLFGQDGALTEYFPTLSQDTARASFLYCVNPDRRADDGGIVRYTGPEESRDDNSLVKIVSLDSGLGSYGVLGKWRDSRDCYYSNDYTEGDHDQQEPG